jgi:hypothetical protein
LRDALADEAQAWEAMSTLAAEDVRICADRAASIRALLQPQAQTKAGERGKLTLDTGAQVFFYEQDHYYLSNFSAFSIYWHDQFYPTSEHAYQAAKFDDPLKCVSIRKALSAHLAFKLAERWKQYRRADWDDVCWASFGWKSVPSCASHRARRGKPSASSSLQRRTW